jgi:uncharacterized protein YxjI
MTDTPQAPPNWYPDPQGRHEYRWFDGNIWTDQVSSNGKQSVDPLQPATNVPTVSHSAEQVQQQVQQRAGLTGVAQGGGTLFTEPILVVNQKAKLIEINNEYAIFNQSGQQVGAVREVAQSSAKKAMRLLSSMDQYMTHKLQVVDLQGNVVLALTRPAKVVKSKIVVQDGAGRELGAIIQRNAIGKIRFGLESAGQELGEIRAENWRAWNFSIVDASGTEVARITKTFAGLAAAAFTTADNYVVQIEAPMGEPFHHLVIAAAVSVDTALKQDKRL